MSAAARAHPRRRPVLAVDVVGVLNVVGTLVAYLSLAPLLPAAVALGYDESPWPFLAATAIAGGLGLATMLATRGDHRLGIREGFLVVSLTWLVAAAIGAMPYVFSGEPQVNDLVDAYFEGMSGFSTTGGSILTDVEALPHGSRCGASSRSGWAGSGSSSSRSPSSRACGSAAASCSSTSCRAGDRVALDADPRHRAADLDPLRRARRRRCSPSSSRSGHRRGRRDLALPRDRACVHHHSHRWLLDEGELDRGLRAGDAVGDRPLHGARRDQLRAHVPRARPAPASRGGPRRGAQALPRPARARCARARRRDLDRGRRVRVGRRPRGRLHGRLDDDDDRLLGGRLQHLARARADDDRRADVRGRLGGLDLGSVKVVRHVLLGKILRREIDQTMHPEVVSPSGSTEPSSTSARSGASRRSSSSTSGSSSSARLCSRSTPHAPGSSSRRSMRSPSPRACSSNVGPAFGVGGPLGRSRRSATSQSS